MTSLNDAIIANKSFTMIALAAAAVAAAVLLPLLFRLASRRRVKLPRNGRARQPRLGIVDAFDLDQQRQLVIVRRDNVEHLLLIGGPNDLVVESEIIRAEGRDARTVREARFRDKDLREKEPRESPPAAAGVSRPAVAEMPPAAPVQLTMPSAPAAKALPQAAFDESSAQEPKPPFRPAAAASGASSLSRALRDTAPPKASPPDQSLTAARRTFSQRVPDPALTREARSSSVKASPATSPSPPVFLRSVLERSKQEIAAKAAPPKEAGALPAGDLPRIPPNLAGSARARELVTAAAGGLAACDPVSPAAAPTPLPQAALPAAGPVQAAADTTEKDMARLLGRGSG